MENNAENFFFSEKGQRIVINILREAILKGPVFRESGILRKSGILKESGIFRKSELPKEAGNYLVSGEGRRKA